MLAQLMSGAVAGIVEEAGFRATCNRTSNVSTTRNHVPASTKPNSEYRSPLPMRRPVEHRYFFTSIFASMILWMFSSAFSKPVPPE